MLKKLFAYLFLLLMLSAITGCYFDPFDPFYDRGYHNGHEDGYQSEGDNGYQGEHDQGDHEHDD